MIDVFIIIIFFLMLCLGLYRGFVKEALGLLGLTGSILLSILFNDWIVNNLINYDNDRFLSSAIGYVLSFLFFSIIFSLLISLIVKIFKKEESSIADRLFGGIVGFIKAYLFCLLFYFVIYGFNSTLKPELNEKDDIKQIELITPEWLKNSKTYPFFYHSVLKLDDILKKLFNEKKEKIVLEIEEKKEKMSELEKQHDQIQDNKNEIKKEKEDNTDLNTNNNIDENQNSKSQNLDLENNPKIRNHVDEESTISNSEDSSSV
jgi:membrane protein required for colicin V production